MRVRQRRPNPRRSLCHEIYGEDYASDMVAREKFWNDARDRVAYVYVTGQFPSHLRPRSNGLIRNITRYYRRPVALDGRTGRMKVHEYAVRDLELERHTMVRKVREMIRDGYFIQPSRGTGTRRNYWKIFMFKLNADNQPYGRITVQGDGSIKQGW